MTTLTVPVSEATHKALCELAQQSGQTVEAIIDKAIDDYQRKVFLEAVNVGYAALRADPVAWAEVEAERKEWDATLMDGLDPNERWDENSHRPIGQAETEQ